MNERLDKQMDFIREIDKEKFLSLIHISEPTRH